MERGICRTTQQSPRRITPHKRCLKLQQEAGTTRTKCKPMHLTRSHQKNNVVRNRVRHKIDFMISLAFLQGQYIIKIMTMKIIDTFLALRYFVEIANAKVRSNLRG